MSGQTIDMAQKMRAHVVRMTHASKASHIGSCFSAADIMAVLYGDVLNVDAKNPKAEGRDRLILSKGHAAAILYAALAERGFFPTEWLNAYAKNGQTLSGHVTHKGVPGVEISTGSLGHGLPVACGMAMAKQPGHVYCIISDGECDEGTTWECALFAAHHKLNNLTLIIDYNKIQSYGRVEDVMRLDPLTDKWRAFNWHVQDIDGHDHDAVKRALETKSADRPTVIIANTVKGKGVSFMENKLEWHYKSPSDEQVALALAEIGA